MRTLKLLVIITLLAGCVSTPAERAAKAVHEVEQMIQVYGSACDKLGYQQDSDAWRSCILHLAAQDDYKRYSRYNYGPIHTHCFEHRGFFDCTTF